MKTFLFTKDIWGWYRTYINGGSVSPAICETVANGLFGISSNQFTIQVSKIRPHQKGWKTVQIGLMKRRISGHLFGGITWELRSLLNNEGLFSDNIPFYVKC